MAASRSALEALLARVQQRAAEPRRPALVIPPREDRASGEPAAAAGQAAVAPEAAVPRSAPARRSDVVPTSARLSPSPGAGRQVLPPSTELGDEDVEDVEEYDEDLIEIIDDARLIPRAAAAARAIEPAAYGASFDRRGVQNGKAATPAPARSPGAGALRPDTVAARRAGPRQVVRAEGQRPEPRAGTFLELLDASLKLGA